VGYILFKWRNFVCLPMMVVLPISLFADDTGAAILRSNPGVLLNKSPAPGSSALFPNDFVETPQKAVARIEAIGYSADINPETMVRFEGDELYLEHGSLSVNTSRGLRVRVGCLTVTPVNNDWTHYDVKDVDGKVEVSALKSDVYIESRSSKPEQAKQSDHGRSIVREGEQKSRDEKCGKAAPETSGAIAGKGAILNSPYVKWSAVGIVGFLLCVGVCHGDDPISPAHP
jgi:hypothetical protein